MKTNAVYQAILCAWFWGCCAAQRGTSPLATKMQSTEIAYARLKTLGLNFNPLKSVSYFKLEGLAPVELRGSPCLSSVREFNYTAAGTV
ncbi:hypothetical protein J1G35_30265, partial [Pseudomonas sp. SH10-3B]|uniref:hypothetical protein n=1 Tax=Pseudomonas sp. SH10-3B TaxID=2816049 RepID=UPI001CA64954